MQLEQGRLEEGLAHSDAQLRSAREESAALERDKRRLEDDLRAAEHHMASGSSEAIERCASAEARSAELVKTRDAAMEETREAREKLAVAACRVSAVEEVRAHTAVQHELRLSSPQLYSQAILASQHTAPLHTP